MKILGVDPGVNGAMAVLEGDRLVDLVDMPTLEDGPKGRRTINAPLVASALALHHFDRAFVEKVGTRPGEGAVGAFAFGRGLGVLHGALAALDVPVVNVTPQAWKKFHGLSNEAKDASRSKAIALWPAWAQAFARVKDDGRAEAALIALAGLRMSK